MTFNDRIAFTHAFNLGGGNHGLTGIVDGLGIEFDTFNNGFARGDIAADHTNFIDTDASAAARNVSNPFSLDNIENGGWHSVTVDWDAGTQTLRYWFDGKLAGTLNGDIVNEYLGGSSLAHFGLTGATGGAGNLQQARIISLEAEQNSTPIGAIKFDPVKLASEVALIGDATYNENTGVVTLTPDAAGKIGGVTFDDRIDFTHDFNLVLEVNLGSRNAGADGMALVIHNDPRGVEALGGGGGNLGLTGIVDGLGIEFDTFNNGFARGDIAADHTNFIDTDAATAVRNVSKPFSLGNIEDGGWHSVIVDWDADTHTLRYWFDGNLAGTLNGDIVNEYLGGSSHAFLGLTGATGGAANLQQVQFKQALATFETSSSDLLTIDSHPSDLHI